MNHFRNVQGVLLVLTFDAEYHRHIRFDLRGHGGRVVEVGMSVVSLPYSGIWQLSSHLASRARRSVTNLTIDRLNRHR